MSIPVYAKPGSRGGFSSPVADSEHLLLCTAASVANKFYGAMAWLGFYSFCKAKAGNMQSKIHMCMVFDIHREHSCLLPGARGVGTREMILQSLQLSPQSAFEEIWMMNMIFFCNFSMIPVIYTAFHGRGGQCDNLFLNTGSEAFFDCPTFSM